MTNPTGAPRDNMRAIAAAALDAVAPGPALRAALGRLPAPPTRAPHLLAIGKASVAMAQAAVAALAEWKLEPAGGVVIAPESAPPPHPSLKMAVGDHPAPGAGSRAAALALGTAVHAVGRGDEAWVLLSGGTTSLIAAPIEGIPEADFEWLYARLLRCGLDIHAMNRIRKRFSRWAAGRLAAALDGAAIRLFVISDVVGDDLLSVGSGPCAPDPTTALDIRRALEATPLWSELPDSIRAHLDGVAAGRIPETPKPEAPVFDAVTGEIISSNRAAVLGAARKAEELGFATVVNSKPLIGEAAEAGRRVAEWILTRPPLARTPGARPWCMVWGGETIVTLRDTHGLGGRCQELALAAAERLAGAEATRPGLRLLALGTDGRDGPTDAAGAVVDGKTWEAVRAAGIDPQRALAEHDAYPALDAAGALVRLGLTGTNVMDVVIALELPA